MSALISPRASREIDAALAWIAQDNPTAAKGLRDALLQAARLIAEHPRAGQVRNELAREPFRFLAIKGYPYLVAYDSGRRPPVISRFVHMARDLPTAFGQT